MKRTAQLSQPGYPSLATRGAEFPTQSRRPVTPSRQMQARVPGLTRWLDQGLFKIAHNPAVRHYGTAQDPCAPCMFDEFAIARADGRLSRFMATMARIVVLVIDDFLIRPLSSDRAGNLPDVVEYRAQLRAMLLTSQLPVAD